MFSAYFSFVSDLQALLQQLECNKESQAHSKKSMIEFVRIHAHKFKNKRPLTHQGRVTNKHDNRLPGSIILRKF